jgi:ribosomal protein L37AE/L43A
MATDFTKKNDIKYCCELCDFNTSKLTDYNRHLETNKHIRNSLSTVGNKKNEKNEKNNYQCEFCGKIYTDRTGLWRHKTKCNNKVQDKSEQLIDYLMKENKEIKDMILELVKNGITKNSHNTTTNSHNKAFNLNFFLNETCKNAMNITDFIESIKLQLSDLEKLGEVGYVEGISKIIVKSLNDLDETVRPIHCTDKKRETMYIKDENQWEKEDDNKTKLRKVVKKIADKNIRLLPQFREKYPDYKDSRSKTSDIYDKMVVEVMTSDDNKDEKIIHNISKATIIK